MWQPAVKYAIILFTAVLSISGEEGPPPHMILAQKLMSQLPEIIQNQMEGKTDGIKNMISTALGGGLISQLVVNPVGVAEDMGVSLDDLGINKTEVAKNLDKMTGGMANGLMDSKPTNLSLFGKDNFLFRTLTTTPATTTPKMLYMDGKPITDLDQFVRKHELEGRISTRNPPTTTTVASVENIATAVLENIMKKQQQSGNLIDETQHAPRRSIPPDDFNFGMIDPRRMHEVNTLLRRAPQNFDSLQMANSYDAAPPGYVQPSPLDPAVDEVVTNLRTRGADGISVEEVKRLQNILQTYEQTLQTKELLAKRKQLSVLQTELVEQQKKLDEQKRIEADIMRKSKELEAQKLKMEQQLKDQLSSWHSSFDSPGTHKSAPITHVDYPTLDIGNMDPNMPELVVDTTSTQSTIATTEKLEETEGIQDLEFEEEEITTTERPVIRRKPVAHLPARAISQRTKYEDSISTGSSSISSDDSEFSSECECMEISMAKMKGRWVMALAAPQLVNKIQSRVGALIDQSKPTYLNCSRIEISSPKQSLVAQDARVSWEFRTFDSKKLHRLSGNALSMDHKSVRIQMKDFHNNIFSMPMCVLKSAGSHSYEYMVVTNGNGPCRETALLVRDANAFFDKSNSELVRYLKHKISHKEMDQMDMVHFANDCE